MMADAPGYEYGDKNKKKKPKKLTGKNWKGELENIGWDFNQIK